MSNYEHVWNKRNNTKTQQRHIGGQHRNKSYIKISGNFKPEKYNNQNKKLSGQVQQQNGKNRGKSQQMERQNNRNDLIWPTQRKKSKKKKNPEEDPSLRGTTAQNTPCIPTIIVLEGEEKAGRRETKLQTGKTQSNTHQGTQWSFWKLTTKLKSWKKTS